MISTIPVPNKMLPIPRVFSWTTRSSKTCGMAPNVRSVIAHVVSYLCYSFPPILRFGVVWLIRLLFVSIVGLSAWVTTFQIPRFFIFMAIFVIVGSVVFYMLWFWKKTNRHQKVEADKWQMLLETLHDLRERIHQMLGVIEEMKLADNSRQDASKSLHNERQMTEALQENVGRLANDIQNMKKLKMDLAEEQKRNTISFQNLLQENMLLKKQIKDLSKHDYHRDIHQIAQHLQTSLSAAKLKLSKVGGFLKDRHPYFDKS